MSEHNKERIVTLAGIGLANRMSRVAYAGRHIHDQDELREECMEHLYFLLGLGTLLLLSFLLSLRRSLSRRFRFPYQADETLFTPSQRAFQSLLEQAVGKHYRVYGKVRVSDIIGVRARLPRRDQERAYARLGDRCFDFVICRPETSAIACAVNLVPRSRLRTGLPRDRLDRICDAACLPFARFRESDHYDLREIQERLAAAMQRRITAASDDEIRPDEAADALKHLSAGILRTERESPAPGQPRPVSLRKTAPAPVLAAAVQDSATADEPAPRLEPVILDHHGIDDGPSFTLNGDLDDERKCRVGDAHRSTAV